MAQWPDAAPRKGPGSANTHTRGAALAARPGPGPRPIAAQLALSPAHLGVIEQSHQRCTALGLSRIERPEYSPLGRPDLAVVRERNRRLHSHAAPVMEMLSGQIAGTESMVVLCDCTGTVIHSIGDDDFLSRASKVALQPGVNWSEQAKGTNAIGTALMEEAPMLVHADEHFMHANHFLTCSAAPILDPRGNILGVLDVTGDHHGYHPHTMALVTMSARMIENHWLGDDHHDAMRLHFHHRAEFIGTLMEGIVAVTPEGRIVGANRSALEQLGASGAALRQQSLESLFGTTVGALVDRFRSPLAAAVSLRAFNGRSFVVHARFGWPEWSGRGELTEPAPVLSPRDPVVAVAPAPSLADLDTGDAAMAALLAKLRRMRDSRIPILLLGDTGTGKGLVARAVHGASARAAGPFVVLNCATLSAAQAEVELPRLLAQAEGGTLFLDDIGELALPAQALLLRLLQERPVLPALICASPAALRERVAAKAFRQDLYYRLNGLALKLPALRQRSDLQALSQRQLQAIDGTRALRLDGEVLALFQASTWPGNLRQLDNVLRAAAALAGAGTVITRAHLPDDFLDDLVAEHPAGRAPAASLQALELKAIEEAMAAAGGNITRVAQQLGVSRNTLYRRLRQRPAYQRTPKA